MKKTFKGKISTKSTDVCFAVSVHNNGLRLFIIMPFVQISSSKGNGHRAARSHEQRGKFKHGTLIANEILCNANLPV